MHETIISLKKQINFLDKTATNYQHVADNQTDCSRDVLGKYDEAQSVKNMNVIVSQVQGGSNDSIKNSEILVQVLSLSGTFYGRKLQWINLGTGSYMVLLVCVSLGVI